MAKTRESLALADRPAAPPRNAALRLLQRYEQLNFNRQILAILALSAALLFLATPLNLIHGYLMAEEGTTYLRYAWEAALARALFAPHQQYLSLYPNLVTLAGARCVPLQYAALLAAWAATVAHLLSVLFVALCERFIRPRVRLLAAILTLLVAGMSTAIDATIQSQFAFGICSLAILISDPDRHRWLRTGTLILGGLNGTISCFLVPFFWYRAWRTRSLTALVQAASLTACTVLQLAILHAALPYSSRQSIALRTPWEYIDVLSTHLLLLPFLTRLAYHAVASHLGSLPPFAWIALALITLPLFFGLLHLVREGGRLAQALVLIGLGHAFVSVLGIEGTPGNILGGGERYFIVANTAIALALVLRLQQADTGTPTRQWAKALVTLLLISSLLDLGHEWRSNQNGPPWAPQIAAWRQDPSRPLHVGPVFWQGRSIFLPPTPTSIDMPFYIFDSNTRPEALQALPPSWFTANPGQTKPQHRPELKP